MTDDAVDSLLSAWEESPFPSTKLSTYFKVYADLFSGLRGTACTFIETGVLAGGSLFMWRRWLGDKARIIGIDLNPEAKKWEQSGFEIYIGDQGDPSFWEKTFKRCGSFDVLLDDGGHQSFQQIITLSAALQHATSQCRVVVEDTHTSFMSDFNSHKEYSFLRYAKDCSDFLTLRGSSMYPTRMRGIGNTRVEALLSKVWSIRFYGSIVAFDVADDKCAIPVSLYNKKSPKIPVDFRHKGVSKGSCIWPDPFSENQVNIHGA